MTTDVKVTVTIAGFLTLIDRTCINYSTTTKRGKMEQRYIFHWN